MINLNQQTTEWLEWRRTRIGASDASIILGINPWKSAYQLWEEKLGVKDPQDMTDRMKRGIELEDKARKTFEEMTGHSVLPAIMEHVEHAWMVASLDGISDDGQVVVEIKCNGAKNHELALDGIVPNYYYAQMQHQMEVVGGDNVHYFSFDGEKGVVIEVPRNDEYIQRMIIAEKEFYQCMMDFSPPPQEYKEMTSKEWFSAVNNWKHVDSQIKFLEDQREDLKNSLIAMTEGISSKGGGIKLCKEIRKGGVDYKNIPELSDVDLEKYRKKPIEFWKIIQDKEKNV
jgi:putative phage-type endonuclease